MVGRFATTAPDRWRRGRRARTLAAAGLAALLALIWWLGRSPAGAVAAPEPRQPSPVPARRKALERGDVKRAELLERMTVIPGLGDFTVSLDLPVDALERQFEGCRDDDDGPR